MNGTGHSELRPSRRGLSPAFAWAGKGLFAIVLAAVIAGTLTYAIAATHEPTWTPGTVPSAAPDLKAVAFRGVTGGYAVGEAGAILHTADGGSTWTALESTVTATLFGVAFPTDTNGWAVGAGGVIEASADGTSWSAQASGVATDLLGVDFADATHGWAVGRGGTLISTTDGGSTWATQTPGAAASTTEAPSAVASATLYGVSAVDTSTAWAWGEAGTLLHTTDGGSTWTTQSAVATDVTLYAGSFLDARIGWVAGSGGTVMRTSDGGSTWTAASIDTTAPIYGITFLDAQNGLLVGGAGGAAASFVGTTIDGGATWTLRTPGTASVFRAVASADPDHGWIVGDGGTALRSVVATQIATATATETVVPALAPPVAVYARALTSGAVIVGWSASDDASSPVSYAVRRSIGGSPFAALAVVTETDGRAFTDQTAPSLAQVAYTISTIDRTGESSPSVPATVTTLEPPAPADIRPASMTCLGCHSSHARPKTPAFTASPDGACFSCHATDIGQRLSGDGADTRHDLLSADQAADGSRMVCANCHQPHVSSPSTPVVDPDDPSPAGALAGASDAFCLRCHDDALPTSAQTSKWAPAPLAAGGATSTADIAASWPGDVHGGGSSTDPQLRSDMAYVKGSILSCTTCHDPHGSTNRWTLLESVSSRTGSLHADGLLVRPMAGGGADLRLFCAGCHTMASHPAADLSQWPLDCTSCHGHGHGL